MLVRLSEKGLTRYESQIYKMLALIVKEVGWAEMVELMSNAFMERGNKSLMLEQKRKLLLNNIRRPEVFARHYNLHKPPPQKIAAKEQSFTESFDTEDIKEIEKPREMPELSKSFEEDKEQLRLPATSQSPQFPLAAKRVCEKIDNALLLLSDDLTALHLWNSEEEARDNTALYGIIVWVHRGLLGERLWRRSMAEKAYRRVIVKGFSVVAWSRLLEFYVEGNNLKGAVACIAEVLDDFTEELGIKRYEEGLPAWLEEALCRLISSHGAEAVRAEFTAEKCTQNQVIMKAIDRAEVRKVHNYHMKSVKV